VDVFLRNSQPAIDPLSLEHTVRDLWRRIGSTALNEFLLAFFLATYLIYPDVQYKYASL